MDGKLFCQRTVRLDAMFDAGVFILNKTAFLSMSLVGLDAEEHLLFAFRPDLNGMRDSEFVFEAVAPWLASPQLNGLATGIIATDLQLHREMGRAFFFAAAYLFLYHHHPSELPAMPSVKDPQPNHAHTGMVYPSRPPSADNDGAFACAVPLYTHSGFTDLEDHDENREWHLVKHPLKAAAFSDFSSLRSYLEELRDPDFVFDDRKDAAKVSHHAHALDLARALYKWCTTFHRHKASIVQIHHAQITVPAVALRDLIVYDPTGRDKRLALSRLDPRISSLFPSPTFVADNVTSSQSHHVPHRAPQSHHGPHRAPDDSRFDALVLPSVRSSEPHAVPYSVYSRNYAGPRTHVVSLIDGMLNTCEMYLDAVAAEASSAKSSVPRIPTTSATDEAEA
ncbi:hypothetical protein B0H16DRAFT_1842654 [Mycena metata]|uniref:Uncharacterized protein n=1 Tax=Mycena metata TaxID=1033252 RepID=A0AAD7IU91_9AGAR|nr:hypothetical protein B0H16DRAFT_1842654 [Mycena metata]